MTDREAIADSSWGGLNDAFSAAISALQEREERIKGCKYCRRLTSIDVWEEDDMIGTGFPKFCTVCGRKLKGAEND